jgi:hypothetical protein
MGKKSRFFKLPDNYVQDYEPAIYISRRISGLAKKQPAKLGGIIIIIGYHLREVIRMYGMKLDMEKETYEILEGEEKELQEKGYSVIFKDEESLENGISNIEEFLSGKKFKHLSIEQLKTKSEEIMQLEKKAFGGMADYRPGKYIDDRIAILEKCSEKMYGFKIEGEKIITAEGPKEELEAQGYNETKIYETESSRKVGMHNARYQIKRKKFMSLSIEQLQTKSEEILALEKAICGLLEDYQPGKYIEQRIEALRKAQS